MATISAPTALSAERVTRIMATFDEETRASFARSPRREILYERDFPYNSYYAWQILAGQCLDDERLGSYCMKRNLVIALAKKHGLRIVVFEGSRYWSDSVYFLTLTLVSPLRYPARRTRN